MYYSDKPILTSEEDSLKRKYFAELMAKALVNLQNKLHYLKCYMVFCLYIEWRFRKELGVIHRVRN